jgi:hypothetical protein
MDRAFSSGASGAPPAAPVSPSMGYATSGNPGGGTPATKPGAWWFHAITEELRALIVGAGLTPDYADVTQVSQAINQLLLGKADTSTTVRTTGNQTIDGVKTFNENLGLGVSPYSHGTFKYLDVGLYSSFGQQIGGSSGLSLGWNAAGGSSVNTWNYKRTGDVARLLEIDSAGFKLYSAPVGNAGNAITFTQSLWIDTNNQLKTRTTGGGALMDAFACRAWVNFNGTGTVAIRASGNVTSITDNGVGDYTVNFTTAMPSANYAMTSSARNQATGAVSGITVNEHFDTARTTSATRISVKQSTAFIDVTGIDLAFFH